MSKKICVIINNRANYARIKSVLLAIKRHRKLKLQLVLNHLQFSQDMVR